MSEKLRIVHYLNQFFAGVGGEEKAGVGVQTIRGSVGPGVALQAELAKQADVVATVVCGDNYFSQQEATATDEIVAAMWVERPDVVIAGPAFNAGRYGYACGAVGAAARERLGVPALTSMYVENPGVDLFRARVYIVPCGDSAASMRALLPRLATLALRLGRNEQLVTPEEDGYLPRGRRVNVVCAETGAERAVGLLLKKLTGQPYQTEIPLPSFERLKPAPPVPSLSRALVALVTEGGVVPQGNPDGIESRRATRWGRYAIEGIDDLSAEAYTCVHGGFDNHYVHEDPDRLLPLDAVRLLEKQGKIGKLYRYFYATVGAGAPISRAVRFGQEIAAELKQAGVDAVIFSAT